MTSYLSGLFSPGGLVHISVPQLLILVQLLTSPEDTLQRVGGDLTTGSQGGGRACLSEQLHRGGRGRGRGWRRGSV